MNAVQIATPQTDDEITMGELRALVRAADENHVHDDAPVQGWAAATPGSAVRSLRVRVVRLAIE
jgi:hypothetical protein